jgi:hemoglobin
LDRAPRLVVTWSRRIVPIGGVALLACAEAPRRPPVVAEVPIDAPEPDPPDAAAPAPPPPSLYTRLGGKEGVAAIVETLVDDLVADKRLRRTFVALGRGAKMMHFKEMLAQQLCEICAGPCRYTGRPMRDAHAHMKVSQAQFDAFVEDFKLALEEKQVLKDDEDKVIEGLNIFSDQIVSPRR